MSISTALPTSISPPPPDGIGINPVAAPPPAAVGDESDKMKTMRVLTNRIKQLKKKMKLIKVDKEKGKPISSDRLAAEASIPIVIKQLEDLVAPLKEAIEEDIDSAIHKKISEGRTKSLEKTREMLNKLAEDDLLLPSTSSSSVTPGRSWLAVTSGATDDELCTNFLRFFGGFKLEGEMEEFYIGESLSLSNRHSKFLSVPYIHLERYNRDLAMNICANQKRLKARFEATARKFVTVTLKAMLPRAGYCAIVNIIQKLRLKFIGMPNRHEKLAGYLTREIVCWYTYGDQSFLSPNVDGFLMVHGILADIIRNHEQGRSWNGSFASTDIEVYNDRFFKITKPAVYTFERSFEIPLVAAGWLQNDFRACEFLLDKFRTNGRLPRYFVQLRRALTKTPDTEFRRAFHSDLYDKLLHHAAIKHPLVRAQFICGVQQACRAHDIYDPDASYKQVLRRLEVPGPNLADALANSGIDIMQKFLAYQEQQESRDADKDGDLEVRIRGPDGTFSTWQNKAAFRRYLLMDDVNLNASHCLSYIDTERHLIVHGPDYSKEDKVYTPSADDDGVKFWKVEGNLRGTNRPRKQMLHTFEVMELMAASLSEEMMPRMISELLDRKAMTGKLKAVWELYKNSGFVLSNMDMKNMLALLGFSLEADEEENN